ncbi:MAG: hypothetical protein ACREJM_07830 [Candidatus Saccharimonadales bacterium]
MDNMHDSRWAFTKWAGSSNRNLVITVGGGAVGGYGLKIFKDWSLARLREYRARKAAEQEVTAQEKAA